jgi:opacity protein-like surface antigen
MMYRLIMCILVIGLVREAAAGDIDTVYLRGSQSYGAYGATYRVQQVAVPLYPMNTPAPSDLVNEIASSSGQVAPRMALDSALPISMGPVARNGPAWLWTGFYVGVHAGAAAGTAKFADPFGSSIFGDKVTTPGFLAGGQVGYNWQLPSSNWVLGVEANLGWLNSDGTNTCLAFSGLFVSANCRAQPNITGDLTARMGWAYGHSDHSLLYVKGGAAFVHNQIDIATSATGDFVGLPPQTTSASFTKVGWTIGAGVEHAIAPAWSMKLEYDYVGFGGESVATPPGLVQPFPPVPLYFLTLASVTSVTQNLHEVKLGLNYRFGVDPAARWGSASPAYPVKAPVVAVASGWEVATGARYWYSSGRFQKDLGNATDPVLANILNSRLTYDSTANAGEFFGRVETPLNVFVKGNIGVGSLSGGHMNDEDWVLFGGTVPYSNTLSDPVKGHIDYATLDVGYDFFRGAGYKLGAFAGFNYYKENKSAYGCTQIANPFSDCVPAIDRSVLVITEDDTWKSLRIGINGEVMIADRLKLGADVAYLPYVKFNGTDNHILRALISPESGTGKGLQLESILSYLVTKQFSVGIGARYWSMWTTRDAITEFGGAPCPCQTLPSRAERYGVFLQASYKFGAPLYR